MRALTSWLWRLVPGNPQVIRIVQGASRSTQHAAERVGYVVVLMVIVLLGLLAGGGLSNSGDLGDLAKAGAQVFRIVAMGQVILVCLIAPFFMAGAIASEQSGKTYNILLTTPLSNLQIVLGSAFALTEEGWRKLTYRWITFFVLLALMNEVARRMLSTESWATFKVFGVLGLTLIFSFTQMPLIQKYQVEEESSA